MLGAQPRVLRQGHRDLACFLYSKQMLSRLFVAAHFTH
jgi:hypothetical protein